MEESNNLSSDILEKANLLYNKEFPETNKTIEQYSQKYDEEPEFIIEALSKLKNNVKDTLLDLLLKDKEHELDKIVNETRQKLRLSEYLTLLEISERKSAEIKSKKDSPIFFQKIRKDFKELENNLNENYEKTLKKIDEGNLKLELEHLISRLINLDFELNDEIKTGTYNFVGKSILWSIPVLIGIYQLIAMKYFELNPIIPLIIYFLVIALAYFILRTNNIKIAFTGLLAKRNLFELIFGLMLLVMALIIHFNQPKIQSDSGIQIFLLVSGIIFLFLVILKNFQNNKVLFIKDRLRKIRDIINSEII